MIFGNSIQQEALKKWVTSDQPLLTLTGVPHLGKSSRAKSLIFEVSSDEDTQVMGSGIDGVREARAFLSTHAVSGEYRYLIIDDADSLLEPAQDALLKMLEEPFDGTKILLIAHEPGYLQPALISRLRIRHRWAPLTEVDMKSMVQESSLPNDVESIRLSAGRPGIYATIAGDTAYVSLYQSMTRALRGEDDLLIRAVPSLVEKLDTGPSSSRDAIVHVLQRSAIDNCVNPKVKHVFTFCNTLTSSLSANAELHWMRMSANLSM